MALHVENQVLTHDGQPNETNISRHDYNDEAEDTVVLAASGRSVFVCATLTSRTGQISVSHVHFELLGKCLFELFTHLNQ